MPVIWHSYQWKLGHQMKFLYKGSKKSIGQSNQDYWKDIRNFNPKWRNRARLAARMLGSEWICDIGCGRQDLSRYLQPGAVYLPSDLAAWGPEVMICDLNKREYPERYLTAADCAVFLGVFERIVDMRGVLADMSVRVEHLCISYSDADRFKPWPAEWEPGLTRVELIQAIETAGFTPEQELLFENKQVILRARSNRFTAHDQRAEARRQIVGISVPLSVRFARRINRII